MCVHGSLLKENGKIWQLDANKTSVHYEIIVISYYLIVYSITLTLWSKWHRHVNSYFTQWKGKLIQSPVYNQPFRIVITTCRCAKRNLNIRCHVLSAILSLLLQFPSPLPTFYFNQRACAILNSFFFLDFQDLFSCLLHFSHTFSIDKPSALSRSHFCGLSYGKSICYYSISSVLCRISHESIPPTPKLTNFVTLVYI